MTEMTGWKRWLAARGRWSALLAPLLHGPGDPRARSRATSSSCVVSLLALAVLARRGALARCGSSWSTPTGASTAWSLALVVAVLGFALGFYVMAQQDPGPDRRARTPGSTRSTSR